jgi:polysaccharide export outer membrane protein
MHLSFSGIAFAPATVDDGPAEPLPAWTEGQQMRSLRLTLVVGTLAVALVLPLSAQAPAQSSPQPAPTPAAPAQAQTPPRGSTAPEYRISRGDKLRVEVYKDDYLSQSLQVRPDGRITLPLAGDLEAAGLTSIELRDRITATLKEFVANPVVTVIVVEVVEPLVYVMGEVNQPGSVPMRGPMTVLQALAVAGGFKEFANPGGIRILRRSADNSKVETIPFNYKNAVKNGTSIFLQEGDTVVVP